MAGTRDTDGPPLPAGLRGDRHLGLEGRTHEPWARRAVILLLAAFPVVGLTGALGQPARTTQVAARDGTVLEVRVPKVLRSGIFFQGRIEVRAAREVDEPTLVLAPGWAEDLQINTIEPSPSEEASDDGAVALTYRRLDRGERLTVWLQFEVNPTAHGRRHIWTELRDGDERLARSDRELRILP